MLTRVSEKISPEPNSGCWLWTGAIGNTGYGNFGLKNKTLLVHRYVYAELVGAIPIGLDLDHKCRIRSCCNPNHLEPVTRSENIKRGLQPRFLAELNSLKTHCAQGHPYSEKNTIWAYRIKRGKKSLSRKCRECHKIYMVSYNRKRRNIQET